MNLLDNLNKLHTTELWVQRIKRNLSMEIDDVVLWCKNEISSPQANISKKWKNFYVEVDGCVFVVNSYSFTIITAHRI